MEGRESGSSSAGGPSGCEESVTSQLQLACSTLLRIADNLQAGAENQRDDRGADRRDRLHMSGGTQMQATQVQAPTTRQAATEEAPWRQQLFQEHRCVFRNPLTYAVRRRSHPYSRPSCTHGSYFRPPEKQQTWAHNFFCVSECSCLTVPTSRQQKQTLAAAGLGEKRVSMPINASSAEFHEEVIRAYPQLGSCGGYELLRCLQKSRTLHVIDSPPGGYTPASIRSQLGQSRIYIRPIQRDIPLTPARASPLVASTPQASGPLERCLKCNSEVPMASLRSHVRSCHVAADSDDDFEPMQRFRRPRPRHSAMSTTCTVATTSALDAILSTPTSMSSQPGPSGMSSSAETQPIVISSDSSDTDAVSPHKVIRTPSADNSRMLCELFPNVTSTQIDLAMMLCDDNVELACQLLLDELNAQALLKHLKHKRMLNTCRRVSINPEAYLSDALAKVYKTPTFDARFPLEIQLEGQPAIDLGGVRRQFFANVIREMATSSGLHLFDGDAQTGPILPALNHDAIISGHFKLFGKVVVHSLLQEGPGFPCLPRAVYRYMCHQSMDAALPYLSVDSLPAHEYHVACQILQAHNSQELSEIAATEPCLDVLCRSGITMQLTENTREMVLQSIVLYEILLKRKLMIDQITEGLETLGFKDLMMAFPNEFEQLFVGGFSGNAVTAGQIIEMIKPPNSLSQDEEATMVRAYLVQ